MSNRIKRILLVEDSKSDQLISKFTINKYNESTEVTITFDGKEALEYLGSANTPPDLILLDINMPGMDGLQFLDHYSDKFKQKATVVVMLTSSNCLDEKDRCVAYDCVKDFITKPLEVEDLLRLEKTLSLH